MSPGTFGATGEDWSRHGAERTERERRELLDAADKVVSPDPGPTPFRTLRAIGELAVVVGRLREGAR